MKRSILPSVLVALGLAAPALAQQAAGGDGRALDANPQVGSGGYNANAPQIDYQLRNDLVTGNVTGGQGFRGNVGYTAPGEFRGGVGSDTVFDFNARSLPPAPRGYNYYGGGAGASVYREYAVPSAQAPLISAGGGAPAYYGGGTFLVAPRPGATYGERFTPLPTEGTPVNSLGTPARVPGFDAAGGYTESPIFGVRQFGRALDADQPALTQPRPTDADRPASTDTAPVIGEEDATAQPDPALNRPVRTETPQPRLPATGFEPLTPTTPDEATTPDGTVPDDAAFQSPTLGLGRRLEPNRAGSPRDAQYARQLHDSIFVGNTGVAAGQSIYGSLLKDVNDGKGAQSPVDAWSAKFDLPEPSDDEIRAAEEQALEAVRKAYGIQDDEPTPDEQTGEDAQQLQVERDPELQKLVEKLSYNLPAITSMAGQDASRSNEMIRQAEAAMGVGDYFKAESLYKQALVYTPDDPMARVGMSHAQLGAGLFRSASLTMRRLFEQHPELIAAKYDARLLPGEERLRWVQTELSKLADRPESDPGFVMAYLGYQINSRQLVRYGLALAQSHNPRDPLLPVVRQIWLDPQGRGGSAAPGDDEAGATAPGK